MYMNNRAAEALAQDRLDDAYAWARAAIRHDPALPMAYNTLDVVYLRHGDLPQAALAFGHVIEREPHNTRALFNLAETLSRQGRSAEAGELLRRLAQLEPEPPFHYFNLGLAAMKRDDFETARALFAKEVARADYNAEFHYWLGLAHFRLGDVVDSASGKADRDRRDSLRPIDARRGRGRARGAAGGVRAALQVDRRARRGQLRRRAARECGKRPPARRSQRAGQHRAGVACDVIERERERALQAQVAELQREVEELRARASTPVVVVPVPVAYEPPVIVAHPLRLRPHGHRFDKTCPHPPRAANDRTAYPGCPHRG
jgi:tetratricopeptide (TPR) repeat protein